MKFDKVPRGFHAGEEGLKYCVMGCRCFRHRPSSVRSESGGILTLVFNT
ncbi:hypothetical protein ACFMPF_16770 [Citrobacter sp. S5]|jgi:hypothetical protein|nr:hypothetical protein [Citrobacter freundii]MDU5713678.1 hypothetical protein [Citrobacter freundii]WHW84635.1 hypothetical protein PXV97_23980 [Citrobacter freundii]WIJ97019.1 hypothetical protein OI904_01840 [Citrobacter freundii]